MSIDAFGTERHFLDHIAPIWHALPPAERGHFLVPSSLRPHLQQLGITSSGGLPGRRDPVLTASCGDSKRAMRAGRSMIARLEHGIGQAYLGSRQGSYVGGDGNGMVGLFLVPNQYAADRWRAAYPDADVAIVGSPKLDELPAFQPSVPPIVAVSFHWDCRVVRETRSAFFAFATAIQQLARRRRVVMHAHPRFEHHLRRWAARHRIPFISDLTEVMATAALYVCDNSSSLYEFAATGRPVVVLNAPGYRREVQHGLRFWDAADVGIQVDSPAGLPVAVDLALIDPPAARQAREAALDVVYAHRDGQASQRAAQALMAWAAQRPVEVAA